MPELAELKIMADYINHHSKEKTFNKSYHVEKGNNPVEFELLENFKVEAESFGKELKIKLKSVKINDSNHDVTSFKIAVFMGMSGNWKFVKTSDWLDTKYVRMRMDTDGGYSLLLYGSYMGPKYKIGGFSNKRGPDPTKQFEDFKQNVLGNLHRVVFNKPICEALLDQKYFNGIGNYLRSTILYYLDVNPFEEARVVITKYPQILDMCRDIPIKAYELNGGQLRDWKNPFDTDYVEFKKWVFYQKGLSTKDKTGRTFWFDSKWENKSPY